MKTILCFGDSNTWGYNPVDGSRHSASQRWPGVLRTNLGTGHWIIEEGLNGRTTVYDDPPTEGRNGKTYLLPCLLTHMPLDLVIVMLGTNDLKMKFSSSAYDISRGLAALVEIILKAGVGRNGTTPEIIIVSPALIIEQAANRTWEDQYIGAREKSKQLARHYQQVANQYGCYFLDAARHITTSSMDGVHLEASQHKILGGTLAALVTAVLG
ncbi:MAG: SGNH/GDSL hydrolase family protein [Anaerolineales bacterium]|nr:SGNH/GDSL hydrolase family protein [Anaerolineales bacterium]